MGLRRLGVALVLVVFVTPPALADVVVPQLPKQATPSEAHAKAAAKAYSKAEGRFEKGRLKSALKYSRQAYDAVANASTALLQAIILGELRRHRGAFNMFLMAADLKPTKEELSFINEGLARHGKKTLPRLGWLTIVAEPANAQITVDNVIVTSPRTVGASAGRHQITVRAEGFHTLTAAVTTTVGVGQRLEYKLVKKELAPPPPKEPVVETQPDPKPLLPPVEVTKQDEGASLEVPAYALIGTGAALLLVGGGMHAWAFDRAAATDDLALPSSDMPESMRRSQWQQAESDMGLATALAGVGYGLGGAALVTGIVLLVMDPRPAEDKGAVVAPVSLNGGAGVETRFRF